MSANPQSELPGGVKSHLLAGYQGNRPLTGYVLLIVGVGVALLFFQAGTKQLVSWAFLLWLLFSLGAELLWLDTPTGEATDSMASTFNVAVLYLFGNTLSLWIIGISVLIATRFIQKRDWMHSLFGLGQMVVTAFVAGSVFRLLAGGPGRLEHFHTVAGIGALVLSCVAYYAVNTVLVSGAIALERRMPLLPTMRTNYIYRNAVTSSGATLRPESDSSTVVSEPGERGRVSLLPAARDREEPEPSLHRVAADDPGVDRLGADGGEGGNGRVPSPTR